MAILRRGGICFIFMHGDSTPNILVTSTRRDCTGEHSFSSSCVALYRHRCRWAIHRPAKVEPRPWHFPTDLGPLASAENWSAANSHRADDLVPSDRSGCGCAKNGRHRGERGLLLLTTGGASEQVPRKLATRSVLSTTAFLRPIRRHAFLTAPQSEQKE